MQLDKSPDIFNITYHLNCSDKDRATILHYDQAKLELVDSTIPITTLVFSIIGLVINSIFIYLTIKGIRVKDPRKALPFKGYSLLLNRSFTDVLTSLLTLIFVSLHKFDQISDPSYYPTNQTIYALDYLIPHGRTMFTLLLTLNFWATAGAYSVLALFMFIAVKHPYYYMMNITKKRTMIIMIVVWLIGLLYAVIVVSISSNNVFNVFNSASDLIEWTVSTEDFALSISNLFIVLLALVIVCASYIAIIVFLWRARKHQEDASAHLMSIGRMALNIFAFTISCVVMAGFVSLPLFLKNQIDELNEIDSACDTVVGAYRLGFRMAQWTTAAMTGWQLRMISDPTANFFLDSRFKQLWKDMCSSIIPDFQPKISHRSLEVASEFLQKCADSNIMPISVITGSGHYFRFRSASMDTVAEVKVKKRRLRRFEEMKLERRVL